ALAEGISLSQASLDIALTPGKLEVRKLEGRGFGGPLRVTMRLEKVAGGVDVAGGLHIVGGALEAMSADTGAKRRASGTLTGELSFAGRGSSVRTIVSGLQGAGRLQFSAAKLPALWPGAIGIAAQAALKAD